MPENSKLFLTLLIIIIITIILCWIILQKKNKIIIWNSANEERKISKVKITETIFLIPSTQMWAMGKRKVRMKTAKKTKIYKMPQNLFILLWNHIDKHHLNQFVTKFFCFSFACNRFRIPKAFPISKRTERERSQTRNPPSPSNKPVHF